MEQQERMAQDSLPVGCRGIHMFARRYVRVRPDRLMTLRMSLLGTSLHGFKVQPHP